MEHSHVQSPDQELTAKLTPRCAEVVKLRVERAMVQDDIAAYLGISQQRVSYYLARARQVFPNIPRVLSSGQHNRIA